jgi:hypothetical protein
VRAVQNIWRVRLTCIWDSAWGWRWGRNIALSRQCRTGRGRFGAGAKQQKGQHCQEAEPAGWNLSISERRDLTHLRYLISYAELYHHDGGRLRATDSVFHVSPILSRSRAG